MASQRPPFFQILIYIAYSFFLGVGLLFLYNGFLVGSFSYAGFALVAIFIMQFLYRKHLINLVLGILTLMFSIWMVLGTLASYNMFSKEAPHSNAGTAMLTCAIIGVVLSVILMFGYGKLGGKE